MPGLLRVLRKAGEHLHLLHPCTSVSTMAAAMASTSAVAGRVAGKQCFGSTNGLRPAARAGAASRAAIVVRAEKSQVCDSSRALGLAVASVYLILSFQLFGRAWAAQGPGQLRWLSCTPGRSSKPACSVWDAAARTALPALFARACACAAPPTLL